MEASNAICRYWGSMAVLLSVKPGDGELIGSEARDELASSLVTCDSGNYG